MANIGEQLLQPESGMQRIDDTNLNFNYIGTGWNSKSNAAGYSNLTRSLTSYKEDYLEFFIYTSKLYILLSENTYTSSNIKITIDDLEYTVNTSSTSAIFSKITHIEDFQTKGIHYVKIQTVNSGQLIFDAIDIDEDGYMCYCDDNGKLYYDVTPIMTSNTTPSGYEVSASSELTTTGDYRAYKAFDGIVNDNNYWITQIDKITNQYLRLSLSKETKINAILMITDSKSNCPKDFILRGSNDGNDWGDIYKSTFDNNSKDLTQLFFAPFSKYKFYELFFINNQGDTGDGGGRYIDISEIRFLLAVDTPFYLINDNGKFYNYDEENDSLVEVEDSSILNENALNNTCIYDLNKAKDLIDLNSVEILCNQNVSLNIDGTKSNKEMIISTQNLSISSAEQINTFKQIISQVNNGNVKTVFSLDNATTWKTWDSTSLSFIDLTNTVDLTNLDVKNMTTEQQIQWNTLRDEINEKGMDKTTIQTLDFNSLFDETHKNIRFAHVLIRPTYEDTVTLQNMTWNINKKGLWHKLSENDIDIAIDLKHCEVKALNKDMNNVKVNILI